MSSIKDAIENTIPISQFGQRLAGNIFDEEKDADLLASATERMSHFNPATVISQKQVDQELGFQPSEFDNTEGIEFD